LQAQPRGVEAPTLPAKAPSNTRRVERELIVSTLIGAIAPFVVFALLRARFAEVPCLLAAGLAPALREAATYARYRRFDPICAISLAALSLGALFAALGDSADILLAKEALVTGVIGAGFLFSLSQRRPAHYYLGRQFMIGNSPARAALYDFAWKAVPQMRAALMTSTLVWGAAYSGGLLLSTVLIYWTPTEFGLSVGRSVFYATTLGLIVWTARRMRRVRRRIEAAMSSPDRSAYGAHPG
jgi:Flp pilus assembly protein TadB